MTSQGREPLDAEEQALQRAWRQLPGGDPPAALDARIRAQARAAASAGRPRIRPWAWGVSTAAAAVLALAVFWNAGLPPANTPLGESVRYRAPVAAPEAVQGLLEDAAVAPAPLGSAETEADAAADMGSAATSASAERADQPQTSALRKANDAGAAPELSAPQAERRAEAPPAAPAAPAPPPPPAAAPAAAAEPVLQRQLQAPPARQPSAAQDAPAPASAAMSSSDAVDSTLVEDDPARWVRLIEALLADGRGGEALRELQRLRARHPDHPLPPALQALLDDPR